MDWHFVNGNCWVDSTQTYQITIDAEGFFQVYHMDEQEAERIGSKKSTFAGAQLIAYIHSKKKEVADD